MLSCAQETKYIWCERKLWRRSRWKLSSVACRSSKDFFHFFHSISYRRVVFIKVKLLFIPIWIQILLLETSTEKRYFIFYQKFNSKHTRRNIIRDTLLNFWAKLDVLIVLNVHWTMTNFFFFIKKLIILFIFRALQIYNRSWTIHYFLNFWTKN